MSRSGLQVPTSDSDRDALSRGSPLRWPTAVALHVTPGVALLLFFLATAPLLMAAGLPTVWGLLLGTLVVITPIELSLVRRAARRRRGDRLWSSFGLRRPRGADLPALLLTGLASLLAPGLVVWLEPLLRVALLGWWPSWLGAGTTGLATYSPTVQVVTMVVWLVSLVVVGPAVEEIYFRGWLLPRLRGGRVLACTTHAALFSVYHLWQPQAWLTVFMFAIPLTVLVHIRRNPALSLVIHSTINLIAFGGLLAGVVQR
jgi:membrane protease YdiL (CAAX protease family)